MSSKSDDLLLYLRQKNAINCSTIESLIKYGFDSNDALMALDLDLDLDFIHFKDISLTQKSLIKQILTQFRSNAKNECNFGYNCCESELILHEMTNNVLNNVSNNEFIENNELLEKALKESKKLINCYKNGFKVKDKKINELKIGLNEIKDNNNKLIKWLKNDISLNTNCVKNLNNLLFTENKSFEINSKVYENKSLENVIKIVNNNNNKQKFKSVVEKAIHKTNDFFINSRKKSSKLKTKTNKCESNERNKSCVKSQNKLKSFYCDFENCGQKFGLKDELKRHLDLVHRNVKAFKCHFRNCGQSFTRNEVLKVHINSHFGYKPFHCDYKECKSRFVNSSQLKSHIISVHNKK